jgi:uncharacterized membrane protein YbaN (DUF454 family)
MKRLFLAYGCIGLGVAGLALPLLPGIPLLILGFGLLGREHWLRKRAEGWIGSLRRSR